jgi:hypothetical protein
MTKSQAEEIKTRVEELNKLYAPIFLSFKMLNSRTNSFGITITNNYTSDEWMSFAGLCYNYKYVFDKLDGYQFAMEAVQAYQEEHGNLKFSQSDAPLG